MLRQCTTVGRSDTESRPAGSRLQGLIGRGNSWPGPGEEARMAPIH